MTNDRNNRNFNAHTDRKAEPLFGAEGQVTLARKLLSCIKQRSERPGLLVQALSPTSHVRLNQISGQVTGVSSNSMPALALGDDAAESGTLDWHYKLTFGLL